MPSSQELLEHQLKSGGVTWKDPSVPGSCALYEPLVAHFGDAAAELQAAREQVAVFDLSNRIRLELTGNDAVKFLHNFCTNNISQLAIGDGCEAFITNAKGRILAHVFTAITADGIWLNSAPASEEHLVNHFNRYLFSEDVHIEKRSHQLGDLFVSGAESVARMSALGIPAGTLTNMQHLSTVLDNGLRVNVQRIDSWGATGLLLTVARRQLVELWTHLTAAGCSPAGTQAFHTLRIEARFPLYGLDVTDDNLAQEANRTEQAISFTKGCYLGQEPIARIDAIGHVNRQLQRLSLDTTDLPTTPIQLFAAEGKQAGTITSTMEIPGQRRTIALAMIRTEFSQIGTQLRIAGAPDSVTAAVY